MNKKKLAELSDEELLKNEKNLKRINAMMVGAMAVLLVINIFLAFKKGFSALSIVPVALLPILIVNFSTLKEMKAEIKLRKI